MWKLHELLESVVSYRELQFIAELTKKLNKMLGIKTQLLTLFHSQTTERMNQELEQYLRFFVNHRQKGWPEWLVLAEFAVNNKHLATKLSLFIANYGRKLRIGADIRMKRRVEKVIEFVEKMKKIQKKAGAVLRKVQEEIK